MINISERLTFTKNRFNKTSFSLGGLSCLLILLITWGCSGTRQEYMYPMFFISTISFLIYAFSNKKTNHLEKVLTISIFLTIIICLIQYFNPFLEKHITENSIRFQRLDFFKYLPTSIKSDFSEGNAIRSLVEISATLSSALVFLFLFRNKKLLLYITIFFGLNALAMGLFGIWQQENDIPIIYNHFYANSESFGTFFLSNAAGAFLNLGIIVNITLVSFFIKKKSKAKLISLFFLIMAILCSYCSYRTSSLISTILMITTWIGVIFILILSITPQKRKLIYIISIISLITISTIGYFLYKDMDDYLHLLENKNKFVYYSLMERLHIYKHAKNIISENLMFGSGGNSTQYLLTTSMIKEQDLSKEKGISTKHAHSDIIEYILDFGALGGLIIAICFVFWIRQFAISIPTEESYLLFLGANISIIHSTIDMNLHILSTMIAFALIAMMSVAYGWQYE